MGSFIDNPNNGKYRFVRFIRRHRVAIAGYKATIKGAKMPLTPKSDRSK